MRMLLQLICKVCGNSYKREQKDVTRASKKGYKSTYCSNKCQTKLQFKDRQISIKCKLCGKLTVKPLNQIKKSKSGNFFCSRNCSGTYNNTHRTKGYRRSKLELWLESKLPMLYPNFEFSFNGKDVIGSELDIYIPNLKLAFELNGIFHYEPIYGVGTFDKIKNNDNRKFLACAEKTISLCVIDTSGQKYFKEQTSQKYLNIIQNIIDTKLCGSSGT